MRLLERLGNDPSWIRHWLTIAAAAAGAMLMVMVSVGARAIDFSYILTAGRMWIAGADPYGAGFASAGAGVLPAGATGFAYPPNWWVIAVAFAAIPGGGALLLWKLFNLAAAGAAGILFLRSAKRLRTPVPEWFGYLFLGLLFTAGATLNALRLGQTSIVVLLGLALLIEGLTSERRWAQVLGLSMLLLKPQIGILFWLLAVTRKRTRGAAAAACVVTIAACVPMLLMFGVSGTIASAGNFLRNLGAYDDLPWNWPAYMSGLPFLFSIFSLRLSPLIAIVAAWLVAEAALRRRPRDDERGFAMHFWLISTGALVAVVPLHLYDFVLCIPCLLLLPSLRNRASIGLLLLCAATVWSANAIARWLFLLWGGSDQAYWAATRLEAGLLTAAGVSTLAAALCHLIRRDETARAWNSGSPDFRPA